MQGNRFDRAAAALLVAVAMGMGCSDDDGSDTATPSTTTTQRLPNCDGFRAGDRIADEDLSGRADSQGEPCVKTFDCADGRIHVQVKQGGEWTLEGFAPVDQHGDLREDLSDAVWMDHGGIRPDIGRTMLQFECGG